MRKKVSASSGVEGMWDKRASFHELGCPSLCWNLIYDEIDNFLWKRHGACRRRLLSWTRYESKRLSQTHSTIIARFARNQSLRAESWDKQSQTFRRKLKNGGASTMYLFCFCCFLLNTSQNVQIDRIDGYLCISAKKIQDSAPLNSLLG